MLAEIAATLNEVREKTPLVQAITNYVTINDCANILICFGASPAMCEAAAEVEEFVGLCSALYINIGTLNEEQRRAAVLAARRAVVLGKPVVLDPVACGVLSRRADVVGELLASGGIRVIKGNIGEIKDLAGSGGKVRGVDSLDDGSGAIEACRNLARKYGAVVAATGKTDIVTDGDRTCLIDNGTSLLALISGSGCMVGALTAAAAGVGNDQFVSTAAAITAMGLAGEMAAASAGGMFPGTFRMKLFDSMAGLTAEAVMKGGRVTCL